MLSERTANSSGGLLGMKGMLIVPSWDLFCLLFLIKVLEFNTNSFFKGAFYCLEDSMHRFTGCFFLCLPNMSNNIKKNGYISEHMDRICGSKI